ncbi:MAG: hypothetical protein HW406_2038, partial [Candidatus Brocadiaceae bacterium]|nr:hypothetical protein [Candidatus Brocadiaceae bacterium]
MGFSPVCVDYAFFRKDIAYLIVRVSKRSGNRRLCLNKAVEFVVDKCLSSAVVYKVFNFLVALSSGDLRKALHLCMSCIKTVVVIGESNLG